ncbi:MAG: response regulator [Myxococcales bacterium]|nr:response regulator [Myxococcales bacterium]
MSDGDLDVLQRALERERKARRAAEDLLEKKSQELYIANSELRAWSNRLEQLVAERTHEMEVARDQAISASQAKSQFLANMSHELRTPLNAIIGYSEILLEETSDAGHPQYHADLQRIVASGRHLLMLISDILDLSKIEAGQMAVFYEDIDISMMVHEVVETLRPVIEKNRNRIDVQAAPSLGSMRVDITKLRQSIFNLLSNAAKFTENGRITVTAQRAVGQPVDTISFAVQDSGIGIKPEHMRELFVPFKQADASTSRKYGGTGLGLALTARFCRMLGGDISVDSQIGVGSTFTLRLPAQPTDRDPESAHPSLAVAQDGEKDAAQVGTTKSSALDGRSRDREAVLVIDDDPMARDMLSRMLSSEGYEVITADDGEEALRLARDRRPLAITLDVLMPKLDGWAVLAQLQADRDLRDIPVVVVSILSERKKGAALGATAYLQKPVQREQLLGALLTQRTPSIHHVLVVEDDPDCQQLLRRMLEEHGHPSRCAKNGREALSLLAQQIPDLILLDLMMPELDGFSLLDALKADPRWRSIPVIVVTARDLSEDERRRLSQDTEQLLPKGALGRGELLMALRRLSSKRSTGGASNSDVNRRPGKA